MFKKISLLAVIFAMIGNVCFAANWIWLASNDEISIYFDGNTCEISDGSLKFWEKDKSLSNRYLVSYKEYRNHTIYTYECIFYDSNGAVLEHDQKHKSARVIPGSQGEKFIRTIASYCK